MPTDVAGGVTEEELEALDFGLSVQSSPTQRIKRLRRFALEQQARGVEAVINDVERECAEHKFDLLFVEQFIPELRALAERLRKGQL